MLIQCPICGEPVNNCCRAYHNLVDDHDKLLARFEQLCDIVKVLPFVSRPSITKKANEASMKFKAVRDFLIAEGKVK